MYFIGLHLVTLGINRVAAVTLFLSPVLVGFSGSSHGNYVGSSQYNKLQRVANTRFRRSTFSIHAGLMYRVCQLVC
ncbi:hypothetical protein F5Y18DRAFT_385227 [Xylariaceae sp. FL1019]|nr:hypothetical protein F5Y18DRAFT_385227 [Xylariaceae sp. FL1019]